MFDEDSGTKIFGCFAVLLMVSVCLFIFSDFVINNLGSSSGQHTGYVTAVEHNSNTFFPSDIAYFKTDTQSTQEDKYCISNEQVKRELEKVSEDKQRVTIFFSNPFITWKSQCNGGVSIIQSIKVEN